MDKQAAGGTLKNRFVPTSICLYANYFVHGMGAIILAQNMDFLTKQWGCAAANVAYVISGMGIGRLLVLLFMGFLSDKFGRKPFVFLGMLFYVGFMVGIIFSPSYQIGFLLAVLAGIANSTLDAGTYPALMEIYPNAKGPANMFTKFSISVAQFFLPLVMSFIIANNLPSSTSFLLCTGIFVVNGLFLIKMSFPDHRLKHESKEEASGVSAFVQKPKMWLEGIAVILIGYTSTGTFYLASIWLPKYGQTVAGIAKPEALRLISYYAVGSLCAIALTSVLLNKKIARTVHFLVLYPLICAATLITMYFNPNPLLITVGAFIVGYSAAGGVLQLALTAMAEFFPQGKGKITGIVYTCSSLATFSIPVITGILSKNPDPKLGMSNIILFDAGLAIAGALLAMVVLYRYGKVFNMKKAA